MSTFAAPQKAPRKSLIIAIPANHTVAPRRLVPWIPEVEGGEPDIIVACAGQPSDLTAIHASLKTAEFLIAPAGTNAAELRSLAFEQAAGDIVTLLTASPPDVVSDEDRDRVEPIPSQIPLSIIVATRDNAATLDATLGALLAIDIPRQSFQLIVVDDSSSDATLEVATRYADTIVRLTGITRGAAYARNRGAEVARGDVLAFVDADVRVDPTTIPRLLEIMARDSGTAAVAASNSGVTRAGGLGTIYWNLLELYGAVHHGGLGALFSASCGVVRRGAFVETGMYNEWVFRGESVEDVELAMRLHRAGHRIHFSREVQVNHLKRYTWGGVLGEVWRSSLLLLRSVGFEATRSGARGHIVHTLVANWAYTMVVLAIAVVAGAITFDVPPWVAASIVALLLLLANISVYRFFLERRGLFFTLSVAPLHWAAQVVCAVGAGAGIVMRNLIGDPAPDPTTQAFAEVGVKMWPPVPKR